jgi:uncharacterized protein (TIGR03067 family)
MHYVLPLLTVSIMAYSAAPPSRANGNKSDLSRIQGEWEFVYSINQKKKRTTAAHLHKNQGTKITFIFRGNWWTTKTTTAGKVQADESVSVDFKLDEKKDPKQVIVKNQIRNRMLPETVMIYRLEGNTLTIRLGSKSGPRPPVDFTTAIPNPTSDVDVMVFKRKSP